MVSHKIKGGFLRKFFPEMNPEIAIEVQFPSDMKELNLLAREGKMVINGKEFAVTAESLCSDTWRGFSLQHQGAEALSEEAKAEKALDRKAERDTYKEMKQEADVKARIAARKAELLAAKQNGK